MRAVGVILAGFLTATAGERFDPHPPRLFMVAVVAAALFLGAAVGSLLERK